MFLYMQLDNIYMQVDNFLREGWGLFVLIVYNVLLDLMMGLNFDER